MEYDIPNLIFISGLVMDDDIIIDRQLTKTFNRQPPVSNLSLPNVETFNRDFDLNIKMASSAIQVSTNLIESNKFYRTNVVESVQSSYDVNKK